MPRWAPRLPRERSWREMKLKMFRSSTSPAAMLLPGPQGETGRMGGAAMDERRPLSAPFVRRD